MRWLAITCILTLALGCSQPVIPETSPEPLPEGAPVEKLEVVATYPHDPNAFTQGLCFYRGELYESTGRRGQSTVRKVELESGKVLQSVALEQTLFGEGLAVFEDKFFQLTWEAGVALVYRADSLEKTEELLYNGEGWGLTSDGTSLIRSDGSQYLYWHKPSNFRETARLEVVSGDRKVGSLNELEWIEGEIWANVWGSDFVARIDPKTGKVLSWLDFRELLTAAERAKTDVLNGIAYDPQSGRLLVTGKLWPKMFVLKRPSESRENGSPNPSH